MRRASSQGRQASAHGSVGLLERRAELERIAELLDAARDGAGAVLLITAPAGLGKTSLLQACAEAAEERGMSVLSARGDELVMESSFAAVRELLSGAVQVAREGAPGVLDGAARLALPVFDAGADVSDPVDAERTAGVLHGLYWLVANLAAQQPVVLLVDDAHWLDSASARFLIYLARRVNSLPVLLAAAVRRGEGRNSRRLEASLLELAPAILSPSPLSDDATALFVRSAVGAQANEELFRACREVTGGNPFYLRELVGSLAAESSIPSVEQVRRLGAGALARTVVVRLARLGSDCERVAQALAVLAPESPLRQVAVLAGLDRERARRAADRLCEAGLVSAGRGLSFVHPIVREAIAAELTPLQRATLHLEAARLLATEGAPSDAVAAHLLSAEPYGERWVIDALRSAAREALARGAPEAAASYLHRAIREPPARGERLELLVELGRAEALLPIEHNFGALREALELADDPVTQAEIALELAWALAAAGRFCEVPELLERTLDSSADLPSVLRERVEALLLGAGGPCLKASNRLRARARPYLERAERGDVDDPVMLAALAQAWGAAGASAARIARLSTRAFEDPRLFEFPIAAIGATAAFVWADEFERAARVQDAGIAEAQRRGSAPLFMHISNFRGDNALRVGDLHVAEGHLRPALDIARDIGAASFVVISFAPVLLERGRLAEAEELVSSIVLTAAELASWQGVIVLAHRGRVRASLGQLDQGAADLLEADSRMRAGGCQLSVLCDWVPTAAVVLAQLGRREEAAALAARELSEASAAGAARRIGMALSTCGRLDSGDHGLELLRDAVGVLERSPARLEHARALVNFGVGLRERGRRKQARNPLAQGLDLADRCGAVALAERAQNELLAAGARPRRRALSGPDSLTPAELRTARLAADGLSNREIAQALFVTAKTVEWQLTHVYAKLEIAGRAELAAALGVPAQTSTPSGVAPDQKSGGAPW